VDRREELRGAGARLVAELVEERRRIERALHDGVQQDLIALSVRLQLVQSCVETDPSAARALIEEVRADVRASLDHVRELADSVYPSLLRDRGLAESLRGLGMRVEADAPVHEPEELEAAAYFCCRELRPRKVFVTADDRALLLELEGVDAAADLTPARDRVEALSGAFRVAADGRLTLTLPRR